VNSQPVVHDGARLTPRPGAEGVLFAQGSDGFGGQRPQSRTTGSTTEFVFFLFFLRLRRPEDQKIDGARQITRGRDKTFQPRSDKDGEDPTACPRDPVPYHGDRKGR